jgi:hypothetical protein
MLGLPNPGPYLGIIKGKRAKGGFPWIDDAVVERLAAAGASDQGEKINMATESPPEGPGEAILEKAPEQRPAHAIAQAPVARAPAPDLASIQESRRLILSPGKIRALEELQRAMANTARLRRPLK